MMLLPSQLNTKKRLRESLEQWNDTAVDQTVPEVQPGRLDFFNPFVPNASFLYLLKTSENRKVDVKKHAFLHFKIPTPWQNSPLL